MKEAGLNYLVGDVPEHSVLLLVTSDGNVGWRDMLIPNMNEDLTDEAIEGITVADIVAFSKNPKPEGLQFDLTKSKLQTQQNGHYVTVFEPEYGQQIQVLSNLGVVFSNLNLNEEAIEAYRQAISLDPKYAYVYDNLGYALHALNRNEEAIEAYRQAISVNPKDVYAYNGIGNALLGLNLTQEAIAAYRQAISLDPKYAYPYSGLGSALFKLGQKKEAIEAYQKFIELADRRKYEHLIKRAEGIIEELRK